ncbi:hypothetical protein EVAR_36226_1 [Eumeta japonica]|uniref:Uncharacterized protein n=1 Tax=Eumeta variegata TaxID=151549 RepID=A0A4C1WX83_EUMVA|nr:hypothetical protein EVAR_36226_1 [Eumeta japonica]
MEKAVVGTVQRTKLCRSELPANDVDTNAQRKSSVRCTVRRHRSGGYRTTVTNSPRSGVGERERFKVAQVIKT